MRTCPPSLDPILCQASRLPPLHGCPTSRRRSPSSGIWARSGLRGEEKRLKLGKPGDTDGFWGPGCSSCSLSPSGLAPTTGGQGEAVPLAAVQDGLAQSWETAHPLGFSVSRRKGVHGRIPTSSSIHSAQQRGCGLQILKGSSPKASLARVTASRPLTLTSSNSRPLAPVPDAARSSSVCPVPSQL